MSPDTHQSFLLRLWRREEAPHEESLLMLEDARTGERRFFSSVAALAAYLEAEAGRRENREQKQGIEKES